MPKEVEQDLVTPTGLHPVDLARIAKDALLARTEYGFVFAGPARPTDATVRQASFLICDGGQDWLVSVTALAPLHPES